MADTDDCSRRHLDRRSILVAGSAVAASALVLVPVGKAVGQAAPQAAAPAPALANWERELRRILGSAQPSDGKISIDTPEVAENGNTVPFNVVIESPMTPEDHVRAIHVLTTANPQPLVATFRLTPDSGLAAVSSRMRLIGSQEVVVVGEFSTGAFVVGRRAVKVTIGCCGY